MAPAPSAKKSEKAAPASAPRPKPATKPPADAAPAAKPVRKRPTADEPREEEAVERPWWEDLNAAPAAKPARKRPATDDADEADAKPARKRRVARHDDDEDDRPPKRAREGKKSGGGKVLLVVLLAVFLVCGGAVAGTVWAVNSFLNAASDALAEMTNKANPAADAGGKGEPAAADTRPAEKPVNPPAVEGLDVRFVAPDFVAGVVINGPRLLNADLVKSVLPDEAVGALGEQYGIDPHKVERVTILAEPTPGGNVLFFPGGVIRFTEAVDGKAVLSKVLKDLQEASADGKSYVVSKTEMMAGVPLAGHVADERTLLIAPEPTLKKMLAAKGNGPLAGQLRRIDLNNELTAAFVVEPVKQLAGEGLKEAKDSLPPEFADVSTLHERLKGGTLALTLGGDTLLKITLEGENEESATVVEKLLGQGKDILKQAYPDLRKGLAPALPPDISRSLLDVVDQVPDAISVTRRGTQVTLTLKTPSGLEALGPKLRQLLLATPAPPPPGKPPRPEKPAAAQSPPAPGLPPKPLLKPTTSGDSLKGDTKPVMDVSITTLKLPKTTRPCLTWADDKGSAFYALDESGDLRRVSYPDLKEEWKQQLGERCAWVSLSSEGLLVTPADGKEVWLIDPKMGEMKRRWAVPGVRRAASTRGSSLGVAATGTELYVLDLTKMTATSFGGPGPQNPGYDDPVMTPDGKYLLTGGSGQIHRYALADGKLRYEESSPGAIQGRQDSGVTVSPDSQLVCYPSYVGGGAQPHKNYTLSVFRVEDLKKPAFVLDPGGTAVGFDPPGGYIYTQNLRLFEIGGKFLKEYQLGGGPPMVTIMGQILPHPAGGKFLIIGDNKVLSVTVPGK
jgi:hypothetical protein